MATVCDKHKLVVVPHMVVASRRHAWRVVCGAAQINAGGAAVSIVGSAEMAVLLERSY